MTITSVGYAGDVTAADWAALVPRAGSSRYGVDGWNDFSVSTAAGTRTVQIASGAAWGYGVRDKNSAPISLALGAAVSGVRWWLIVARRDWSAGTTTIVAVDAGAAKAIPTHNENPGTLDDQPLALVRVGTGAPIAEIVDLRVLARDGGLIGFDQLTLQYMNRPGTVIRIADTTWTRVLDGSGSPVWEKSGLILPPLFTAAFRRSDGGMIVNTGPTLMKWQSVTQNTDSWPTSADASGAKVQLPAGKYRVSATIRVAVAGQNWSYMFPQFSGPVVVLADSPREVQSPGGFYDLGFVQDVFLAAPAWVGVAMQSNNAGTMRADGQFRVVEI